MHENAGIFWIPLNSGSPAHTICLGEDTQYCNTQRAK